MYGLTDEVLPVGSAEMTSSEMDANIGGPNIEWIVFDDIPVILKNKAGSGEGLGSRRNKIHSSVKK